MAAHRSINAPMPVHFLGRLILIAGLLLVLVSLYQLCRRHWRTAGLSALLVVDIGCVLLLGSCIYLPTSLTTVVVLLLFTSLMAGVTISAFRSKPVKVSQISNQANQDRYLRVRP